MDLRVIDQMRPELEQTGGLPVISNIKGGIGFLGIQGRAKDILDTTRLHQIYLLLERVYPDNRGRIDTIEHIGLKFLTLMSANMKNAADCKTERRQEVHTLVKGD
jgi:hypothetical protein